MCSAPCKPLAQTCWISATVVAKHSAHGQATVSRMMMAKSRTTGVPSWLRCHVKVAVVELISWRMACPKLASLQQNAHEGQGYG